MKYLLTGIVLLYFHFHALAQLDLKSISFDIQKEIPGEIHYPDSVEYKMFLEAYKKSGDIDSTILWGMSCVEEFSHDTSYFKNYSISENIHVLDINEDHIDDFLVDFSIWGCSAYSCRAYISSGNRYSVLDFRAGFITQVILKNKGIIKVQNKIYQSPMYGLNSIKEFNVKNNKIEYTFFYEYIQNGDSLLKSNFNVTILQAKKDSVKLYMNNPIDSDKYFGDNFHYKYQLKNKKIQLLKEVDDWYLVTIEAFDKYPYEENESKPQKYFVTAWMRKEDLE